MKRYVIQSRKFDWDTWRTLENHQFDTLEEAKKFFEALPFKKDYRIAESYVVVRFKPVKI